MKNTAASNEACEQCMEFELSYFDTYGPLSIEREDGAFTGRQASFWGGVEEQYEGLRYAIGCYAFCLEYRGVIRPWCIGRTLATNGFCSEVFTPHKRQICNEILGARRGNPNFFFFPLMTADTNRFSNARNSSKHVVSWLEVTLMSFAHRRNPEISNIRDMTFLRNVEVLGLIGKRRGRPFRKAQAARKAFLGNLNF